MSVLVCDCDGVLLNWRDAFNQWLVSMELIGSLDEWSADQYDLPTIVDPAFSKKLMNIFNQTHYIAKLAPVSGAVRALKEAHAAGFSIKVVTAFSDQYESMRMREENLINVFGPIFQDITSLAIGTSKEAYLRSQPKDSIYVEDYERYLKEALTAGLSPDNLFMIPQPWNQPDADVCKYGVRRVGWSIVRQLAIGA